MRKAFLSVLGLAIVAGALMAPMASAANEKLKIREFFPGGAANDSYIVLQAYAPGQNHLAGHTLRWQSYSPTGVSFEKTFTFPSDVSNGANQSTVLIADSGYSGSPAPDFTVPNLTLYPVMGLICIDYKSLGEEPPYEIATDCVSWGGNGASEPPYNDEGTGFGFPAFQLGGVVPGKAAIRQIGINCPTLLEGADDQNQGNSDWYETTPNPRDNASPIVEKPCSPPHTGINSATVDEGETTSSTSARIAFAASPFKETTYECKLDAGAFEPCVSPVEYTGLDGSGANGTPHEFEVRAGDASGVEQTPATLSWVVNTSLTPDSALSGDPASPAPSATAAGAAGAGTPTSSAAPASAAAVGAGAQETATPKKHRRAKHRRARRAHQ